jgi:hypothetical protein
MINRIENNVLISPKKSDQSGKYQNKLSMIAELEKMPSSEFQSKLFAVTGTIGSINLEKQLYYIACKNCKKKVQGEVCSACEKSAGTVATFIFNISVNDGTGAIWVHVLGDIGENLIGKTAEEVKLMKESGDEQIHRVFDNAKIGVNVDNI